MKPANRRTTDITIQMFPDAKMPGYTGHIMSCQCCKIIEASIPSTAIYSDGPGYAFADINPQAPVHVLIVPREQIPRLIDSDKKNFPMLGHLLSAAAEIARAKKITDGYRIVVNAGEQSGQTADTFHLHLLGGRQIEDSFPASAPAQLTIDIAEESKAAESRALVA
jgi:histidine triad (HIT) family protein